MGFKEKDPIRRMSPGVKNFSVFNGLQRVACGAGYSLER